MRGHIAEDITGIKYGELLVISRVGRQGSIATWLCKCSCGKETVVRSDHLKSGKVISCGHVGRANCIESHRKHNGSHSRLYGVWCNMKNRCYNENLRSYKNYGMNGVTVCAEWLHDFSAFSKWAYANGYDPDADYGKCTLDRIDVTGNYCPENCRWADAKTQANNRRNNRAKQIHHAG